MHNLIRLIFKIMVVITVITHSTNCIENFEMMAICSELRNITLDISCDKLQTTFESRKCTKPHPKDCIEKRKQEECFRSFVLNLNVTENFDNETECIQFYCYCLESIDMNLDMSTTQKISESESKNASMTMIKTEKPEMEIEMSKKQESKMFEKHEMPDINLTNTESDSEAEMMSEEMESNNGTDMRNDTMPIFAKKSDKYIRQSQSEQDQAENSGDNNNYSTRQRDGSRKPDYSTTTTTSVPIVHHPKTTQRNIYEPDGHKEESRNITLNQGQKHEISSHQNSSGENSIYHTSFKILSIFLCISFSKFL